ncbi:preprotein translocase subunit SecA [Caulifigura coniformis]|uniref:Preprotein translocase subunit SecA n=1 Tax=Caulifigura coniformis TaxID=2527983 RepID=A0A517SDK3_9PLAN|nr:hypothetical protein [Caulifigura coniformis]QDT54195.1 preprotein translocase subunit SecA [Caulifigura coniformis]
MGWWNVLFGGGKPRRLEERPDRLWMTADARFEGLRSEAIARSTGGADAVLLVAHFPDVLARLDEMVGQRSWAVPCRAVPASDLSRELAFAARLDESAVIDLLVAERHPLPSVDEELLEFARGLPCRCRMAHVLSLEDPVLKAFAGDRTRDILRRLGMKEDEAIESAMVTRQIRKAQQKIEGRTFGSLRAGSAAEWLAKNCPELVRE